jgi:hypothetical protein
VWILALSSLLVIMDRARWLVMLPWASAVVRARHGVQRVDDRARG